MRIAVVSDIHGNMEAFSEVLSDIDRSDIDEVISLGDNIGYGPESDLVIELLRERGIESVMGNHELAVSDPYYLSLFNPTARLSSEKTLPLLSDASIEHICSMNPFLVSEGYRYVHGLPPDSITTYLFEISLGQLQPIMNLMEEPVCFVGHTHLLEAVILNDRDISRKDLYEGRTRLEKNKKYIINTGSVGQPRDGDNKAKYIVWDTSDYTVEVKYIAYDIESVAKKIIATGLPEVYARRLW
jgi:predicted phosphodiesterase